MTEEQRIIHFDGNVQGVGFRYTACRIAMSHKVGGYVRNLNDGKVECVIEGNDDEIDAFLKELSDSMGYYIHNQTQQKAPFSGRYKHFDVKF